jgi:uncharacterized protein YceK
MKNINILLIFLCLWLSACASVVRNPVPEADHMNVTVLDRTDLRQWGDRSSRRLVPYMQNAEDLEARWGGIMHREHNYLVVSGGGANGAYGAGVLVAWTKLGTRPVIWNITRIAASGHPSAAKLIHQVLLASASIPGAFPPVYIEVETPDGRKYDEMHVDGGVTSQMFLYPVTMDWSEIIEILDVKGAPTIYVIRNAFAHDDYKVISPRLIPITDRTISSLIRTQGVGDFFRIWTLANRDGLDLEVTWIPDDAREEIGVKPAEVFDPRYMEALFKYGYQRTIDKGVWQDFSKLVDDARK